MYHEVHLPCAATRCNLVQHDARIYFPQSAGSLVATEMRRVQSAVGVDWMLRRTSP